jgi:hypothetical protein
MEWSKRKQGIVIITIWGTLFDLTDSLPFIRFVGDLHVWIVLSHLGNQLCWRETDSLDVVGPRGRTTKQDML